jgi:hypothetical protein
MVVDSVADIGSKDKSDFGINRNIKNIIVDLPIRNFGFLPLFKSFDDFSFFDNNKFRVEVGKVGNKINFQSELFSREKALFFGKNILSNSASASFKLLNKRGEEVFINDDEINYLGSSFKR